jgi:hypothetical protein
MPTRMLASVGIVALSLAGGIASAAVPDPAGVIHGCYAKPGLPILTPPAGTLRVIDSATAGVTPTRRPSAGARRALRVRGVRRALKEFRAFRASRARRATRARPARLGRSVRSDRRVLPVASVRKALPGRRV